MRSDYKLCPLCGAALDIGEQCNCMEYKEPHGQQIRPEISHQEESIATGKIEKKMTYLIARIRE